MRSRPVPRSEQFNFELPTSDEMERIIEARVAERCQVEALRWRFQLITVETAMMGLLVAVAGIALEQPTMLVARAAVIVAGSCFASGLLLLGLSAWTARLLERFKQWRRP